MIHKLFPSIREIRLFFARPIERILLGPQPITIISEDCWGGEFCRATGRPYTTPLAGAFIPSADYLNFLKNLNRADAFELVEVASPESYPVGRTPYASIHFLHFHDWEEAKSKFQRRAQRIAWDRIFYKIDFGKPGYRQEDVAQWTSLSFSRAIALLPPSSISELDFSSVSHGVPIRDWCLDGAVMFHVARRYFDFYHWIRTGEIRQSWLAQLLNILFCDPYFPARLRTKIRLRLQKTKASAHG
jgi:uncharacterized protein (DUF1919 family)